MARRASHGSRRKTQWLGLATEAGVNGIPNIIAIAAGAAGILSFNTAVAAGVGVVDEEFTITRLIGNFTVKSTVDTANAVAGYALGCYVARGEAVAAGVASLPSPVSDPDAEWLYYNVGRVSRGNTASIDNGLASVYMPFDVRGQRIVRAGSTVVWIGEAVGGGIDINVAGRYLSKLT